MRLGSIRYQLTYCTTVVAGSSKGRMHYELIRTDTAVQARLSHTKSAKIESKHVPQHALVNCPLNIFATMMSSSKRIQLSLHYSLEGLLPPVVESIELQSARYSTSISAIVPFCHRSICMFAKQDHRLHPGMYGSDPG